MKVTEKQKLKRKEIAKKIIEAIQRSNSAKLTVDEMCDAADIAKGTFYHYFSSKEDLLSEVLYSTPIDELFSIVEKDINKSAGFMEAILSYTKTYSEHILSSGYDVCRTVLLEMLGPDNSRFHSYERRTVKLLYDTIKNWQAKGEVTDKQSAKKICDMFIIAIRGYMLNWYMTSENYDLTEAMTTYARVFASSLLVK